MSISIGGESNSKMSRRNLPLNALRAFEAAARHCHLRRAADELGVTHGAVSRQVKQLEHILGVELFDRSHNRLALTSAGIRLNIGVGEALDRIAETSLSLDPETVAGPLVIASTPSISVGWLLRVIGEFSRRHPEVALRLQNIDPLQRDIGAEIDVAICYGQPEAGHRQVRELFREQYFPVCSPALLSSHHPVNTPADLLHYPLLHDRHNHWSRWLSRFDLGHSPAGPNMYLQDTFQVICAVREGFGIGLADRLEVEADLRSGSLLALFEQAVPAEQGHFIVTDSDNRMALRVRLFVEHLQQSLALM